MVPVEMAPTGIQRKGATEARDEFSSLVTAAEHGQATIITRYGKPVAALVPIRGYVSGIRQQSLLPLAGSGRGMWGENSTRTLRRLRDEWDR